MFAEIFNIKHNHVVAIQDKADQPGKFLIRELISTSSDTEFHIFCYDYHYRELMNELKINWSVPIYYYDCLPTFTSPEAKAEDELLKFIKSLRTYQGGASKLVIIVDSLSTLLLVKSFHFVCRILHHVKFFSDIKTQIQMVVLLHEDTIMNPAFVLKYMKNMCRAWLQVESNIVNTWVRKMSGKFLKETYEYEYSKDGKLIYNKKKTSTDDTEDDVPEHKPVSTFRLALSESEKKARDAVKLPYERHEEETPSGSDGQIFYVPDECDDWDEEDPDNDLEFS